MNEESSMTFQELGEVQSAERGSTALTKLPDQFYERAATYLKWLLTEIENSPSGKNSEPDASYYRRSEEYRRAKDVMERIYSTRERKIVLAALNSSRGVTQSTENMVHDEEELYYSLKMELETIRDRILRYDRLHRRPDTLRAETGINTSTDDFVSEGETAPGRAPSVGDSEVKAPAPEVSAEKKKGSLKGEAVENLKEKEDKGEEASGPDLVVIRALKDIEPFVGIDGGTVSLRREDIASIPFQVAEVLVKGGMAQILEERG
ncbi:hypothetical protein B6U90_02645 [Thermoplasmatales archaeon ex4484_6]|nr:MAG: hypothetical protein B6U90_02645 [Thermoplasmatales archaeon ex4484_6]